MMPKKRGYKRELPTNLVRDYKLFAIACEGGKREPNYFRLFEYMSDRITIDIIEDIVKDDEMNSVYETKSAPRWVLDRAIKYIEKEGLIDEDDLWFVIDKDKWSIAQIKEIADYCKDKSNWHIAISNPCFEVWLFFHFKTEITNSDEVDCKVLKGNIAHLTKGGYSQYKFIPMLNDAIKNSKTSDKDTNHYLPETGNTKVYLLGEALLQIIGAKNFNEFITIKLPELILSRYPKKQKRKKRE